MKYSKQAGMAILCASTVLFSSVTFAAEPGFIASIKAANTSDDNVFREVDGASDNFFTVSPDLSYTNVFGKHQLTLGYLGDYAAYDTYTKENYTDHTVNADLLLDLTRKVNVNFQADYANLHESRGQSGVADNAALDVTKLNKNSAFAGIAFGGEEAKMQFELDYKLINTDYTNNQQDSRDRRDDTVTTRLFYKVGAKTKAFVEARQNNFNYLNGNLDSTEKVYLAGVRWDATEKTQGEIKVGSFDKNFDSVSQTDGSGSSIEANVTWSPKTYSNVTFGWIRGPQESAITGESYYTSDLLSVNWNHEFGPKLALNVDVNKGKDDYISTREDETTNASLAMNYKFRRWLSFGLEFANSKRTSNNSANEFTSNRVMVSATLLKSDY